MRLGVLDVGSNTVHLLVVDAHPGARPAAAHSHKTELRLLEHLDADGCLTPTCTMRLSDAVAEALDIAEDKGVEDILAFATSALRDAGNGEAVLAEIRERTGVVLEVLPGVDEARLTFLAVRRWYGWSAGRLLVVDIGGGSLELACGIDEEPDAAVSLPLGAARLTRRAFTTDPPSADEVKALRKYVRTEIARDVGSIMRFGPADFAVATSKTLKQLARMAGAAATSEGPYVRRSLTHTDLVHWLTKMADMSSAERAGLPGVSTGRARQLLAGAIVADAVMSMFGIHELEICPWALREGLILRRLDLLLDTVRADETFG